MSSTVTLPRDEGKRRRAFRKRDRITVALSSPFAFAFAAAPSLFVLRGAFLPAVAHVPRLRNGEAERLKRNLRPAAEFCAGIFAELYPFLKSTLSFTKFDQSPNRPDVFSVTMVSTSGRLELHSFTISDRRHLVLFASTFTANNFFNPWRVLRSFAGGASARTREIYRPGAMFNLSARRGGLPPPPSSASLIRIHISQREVQGREEQKEEAEGEV